MARSIEMTELERKKLADAGRQSISCTHGWQPIETAPIGQYVLIAFYWKKYKEFYEEGQPWDIGCGTYTGGRYVDQLHLDLNDMDAVWMPLPKPPEGQK